MWCESETASHNCYVTATRSGWLHSVWTSHSSLFSRSHLQCDRLGEHTRTQSNSESGLIFYHHFIYACALSPGEYNISVSTIASVWTNALVSTSHRKMVHEWRFYAWIPIVWISDGLWIEFHQQTVILNMKLAMERLTASWLASNISLIL